MPDEEEQLPEFTRYQINVPDDTSPEEDEWDAEEERIAKIERRRRGRVERGNGMFGTQ